MRERALGGNPDFHLAPVAVLREVLGSDFARNCTGKSIGLLRDLYVRARAFHRPIVYFYPPGSPRGTEFSTYVVSH
jgi:hypothetical protein